MTLTVQSSSGFYPHHGWQRSMNVLDALSLEAGVFYVMDRGCLDFSRLFTLHQSGAFFVTRAKRGMNVHRVYSMKVDRGTGIICESAYRARRFLHLAGLSRTTETHLVRRRYSRANRHCQKGAPN